jgi:ABC-type branched-subunit amino acid transport system substrate-binding protein
MVLSSLVPLASAHHDEQGNGEWLELRIEIDGAWETVDHSYEVEIPFLLEVGNYELGLWSFDLVENETYNLSWEFTSYNLVDGENSSWDETYWFANSNSSGENLSIEVDQYSCQFNLHAELTNSSGDFAGAGDWWLHGPCGNNGLVGLEIDDGATIEEIPDVFDMEGEPTEIDEGSFNMTWTFWNLSSGVDYNFYYNYESDGEWVGSEFGWNGPSPPGDEASWTLNVTMWQCDFWISGDLFEENSTGDEEYVSSFWAHMAGPCVEQGFNIYLEDENGSLVEYEMVAQNESMDSCEEAMEDGESYYECHDGVDVDDDGVIDWYDYHYFLECDEQATHWECVGYDYPFLEPGTHYGTLEMYGLTSDGGQWAIEGVDEWLESDGHMSDWPWDSGPLNMTNSGSYNSTTETWSVGWTMHIDPWTCEYRAYIEIWTVEWNPDGSDEHWNDDQTGYGEFGWYGPCEEKYNPFSLYYDNGSGYMVEYERTEHWSEWDHCDDHTDYYDCYYEYDSDGDGYNDSTQHGSFGECHDEATHWECLDYVEQPYLEQGNQTMELVVELEPGESYFVSGEVVLWQEEWNNWYEDITQLDDDAAPFNSTTNDSDGDGVVEHSFLFEVEIQEYTCDAVVHAWLDGLEWHNNSSTPTSWVVGFGDFEFHAPCIEQGMPITLFFEESEGSEMLEYYPEYLEWNYPSLDAGNLSIEVLLDIEGDTSYLLSGVDEFCGHTGCREEPWNFTFDTESNWTWYRATGGIVVSEFDCEINLGFNLEIIEWVDDVNYNIVDVYWDDLWYHFWGPCEEPPSPFTLFHDDVEWAMEWAYDEFDNCEELASGYACTTDSMPEAPEDVEIAFLHDMTGPISQFSYAFIASAEIAIDKVNAAQSSYNFSIVTYNSGCDGNMASSAADDIVDDGIELVVGALCSGATIGANSVLSSYGIPHLSPTSTSPALSDSAAYPGFYRVVRSDALEGHAMSDLVADSNSSSPVVVYASTYASGVADSFADEYLGDGGTLCDVDGSGGGELSYDPWDWSAFSDVAETIVDSGCDSMVLFSDSGNDAAGLIEELDSQGYEGSLFGWSAAFDVHTEISNTSMIDGMMFSHQKTDWGSPNLEYLNSACENNTDCDGGIYLPETFDAFSIMAESYIASRGLGLSMEEALDLVGYGWEGAGSSITFNDDGDVLGPGYEFCTWDDSASSHDCSESWGTPDEFSFEAEEVIDAYDWSEGGFSFYEECENNTGTWHCQAYMDFPMIGSGEHTIVVELDGLPEETDYNLEVGVSIHGMSWTTEESTFQFSTGTGESEGEVSFGLTTQDWDCGVYIELYLTSQPLSYWDYFQFLGPCEDPPDPFTLQYESESGDMVEWEIIESIFTSNDCSDVSFGSEEEAWYCYVEEYQSNIYSDDCDQNESTGLWTCVHFTSPLLGEGDHEMIWDLDALSSGVDYRMKWWTYAWEQDEEGNYHEWTRNFTSTSSNESIEWTFSVDRQMCTAWFSAELYEVFDEDGDGEPDYEELVYTDHFNSGFDGLCLGPMDLEDFITFDELSVELVEVDLTNGSVLVALDLINHLDDGIREKIDYHFGNGDAWLNESEATVFKEIMLEDWDGEGGCMDGGWEADTDNDGMPDNWEVHYGLDPNSAADGGADNDGDGLDNLEEYELGTNPNSADTDGDGISDANDPSPSDYSDETVEGEDGDEAMFTLNELDPWCGDEWIDFDYLENGSSESPIIINGLDLYYDNVSADENGQLTFGYPGEESVWERNTTLCGIAYASTGFEVASWEYNGTPREACVDVEEGEKIESVEIVFEAVDSDGDGYNDLIDKFPGDSADWNDTDDDGVGDNSDAFPNDSSETADTDGDGVGDNADAFPNDANEFLDSDGDGWGDNSDDFPNDANETSDADGDGVGDNADAFPWDPTETADSDGDGWGDNSDAFPTDSTEWVDTDGDNIGDNADTDADGDGTNDDQEDSDGDGVNDDQDAFPFDENETVDTDGDGVGDNADAFPTNASETTDTDGDGIGDNSDDDADGDGTPNGFDDFPLNPAVSTDTDGDGVGDAEDAFPNDANEYLDTDGDGIGDNADTDDDDDGTPDTSDAFPTDASETTDTDGDGYGDNSDLFPNDAGEWSDYDGDGVGDNSDAFMSDPYESRDSDGDGAGDNSDWAPNDPNEKVDSDGDGVGNNADAFPTDASETTDTDGDGIGDNADDDADGDGIPDEGVDDPTDDDDGGILPGFTAATGLASVLGAAILVAGRRKD